MFFSAVAGYNIKATKAAGDLEEKLNIYLQVLDSVKNDYVDKDLDNSDLIYGSIKGLLEALDDPYTRFMEPKAYKEMKIRLSGSYSGIGIYIGIKKDAFSLNQNPMPILNPLSKSNVLLLFKREKNIT